MSQGHSTDSGMTWTHTCLDCNLPWPCPSWLDTHPGECREDVLASVDAALRAQMHGRSST